MQILQGGRIGKTAELVIGCAAIIFDDAHEKILLTRRSDNGRWCLPGGRMEAGESASECCIRETREETQLDVEIVRLVGVYSSPDMVIQYKDGNRRQVVAMSFECRVIRGTSGLSDETTEVGWFTPKQIETMDLVELHRQRIPDALEGRTEAFIR